MQGLAGALAALGGALAMTAGAASAADSWKVRWKNGTRVESPDGNFKLKFGGRIQNDWFVQTVNDGAENGVISTANPSEPARDRNGTRFRRARLFFEGAVYRYALFKAQFDFAGGDVDLKDVYLGLTGLPGNSTVRVGHFKEPFSLEEMTSSKYLTFLERSSVNAFSPSRNTGLGVHGHCGEKCFTWGFGIFRDVGDTGDGSSDGVDYDFTGRLTAVPWSSEDDSQLLHVGVSYSHQLRDSDVRFRARPGNSTGGRFVDTGSLLADGTNLVGAEAALVCGPASLQGEYVHAFVNPKGGGKNAQFHGFYSQVSYFLTGEHRAYKRSAGSFDRISPRQNFDPDGSGWGAWELAARVDYLDLDDGPIVTGGKLWTATGAVNWYLFPNFRVMMNYVYGHARRQPGRNGESHVAQARFQIDF